MMKILLLVSCFLTLSTAIAQESFSGRWSMLRYYPQEEMPDYFSITLLQNETKITGFHNGVFQRGNRIESLEDSIDGELQDSVVVILIRSGRASTPNSIPGVAKLKLIGVDSLQFTLVKKPVGGDPMIPQSVILIRDKTAN